MPPNNLFGWTTVSPPSFFKHKKKEKEETGHKPVLCFGWNGSALQKHNFTYLHLMAWIPVWVFSLEFHSE